MLNIDQNSKRNLNVNMNNINIDPSNNHIVNKALLKGCNMDVVLQQEYDYFFRAYGTSFDYFYEVNLNPILKFSSFIIYNF